MTFEHLASFDGQSPIPLARSDRDMLARLLSRVVGADGPAHDGGLPEGGRGELAKRLYDQRRSREHFMPADLFGEPIWDILLILYWARHSQRRLSVSAACASSGVPSTTALRYIEHLCRSGYLTRDPHPTDRRMSWLSLTEDADRMLGQYLDRIASGYRPVPRHMGCS